jgi:predicted HTH domain antitoxin
MLERLERVVIEVPESLRVPPDELGQRLRVEFALRLYEKGIASLGRARRIAGLSKWDLLELLAGERMPMHYGGEGLKENLEVAKRLAGRTNTWVRTRLITVSSPRRYYRSCIGCIA